jgi:hypothetical protein
MAAGIELLTWTVTRMSSWDHFLTDWSRYFSSKLCYKNLEKIVDVELGALLKTSTKSNHGPSLDSIQLISNNRIKAGSDKEPLLYDHICLIFSIEGAIHTKMLDYGTFARWDAMERLMKDIERDGIAIEELWDVVENMKIASGDWEARVRQGWKVFVRCQGVRSSSKEEDDINDSKSEAFDTCSERTWEHIDNDREDWCLLRWRRKVEQQRSTCERVQEPSWTVLGLSCASMVFLIIMLIVYTI